MDPYKTQESLTEKRTPAGTGARKSALSKTFAVSGAVAAVTLGMASLSAVPASAAEGAPADTAAATTEHELVANGSMETGTSGWRTNDVANQELSIVNRGHTGGHSVALSTVEKPQTAVLNDAANTVGSTVAGTEYAVSAWVRTDTPGIAGQLRIREEEGSVPVSSSSFWLTTTAWTHVHFNVTAQYSGASMDLNVLAWNLQPGTSLDVDDVSMTALNTASTPAPTPTPTPTPPPAPTPTPTPPPAPTPTPTPPPAPTPTPTPPPAPVSSSKTVFGSSLGQSSSGGTRDEALAREQARFGSLGTVRLFDNTLPSSWASLKNFAGKSLIISFRPAPADVLAGKYDAQLLEWFKTAPRTQETYWSYIHEPEAEVRAGKFTSAQYRAAWRHIATLEAQAANPHLHATSILMAWTLNPSSGLNWRDYYPGDDVIDVLGWDPYNDAGSVAGPHSYPDPAQIFGSVVAASKSVGKPFGIAETGSRLIPTDPTGTGRAAWLTKVGQYLKDNKALFVSYWDSAVSIGDYRLTDGPSAAAWRKLVAG